MIESVIAFLGITQQTAAGGVCGSVLIFLRRRDLAGAWMALAGLLLMAFGTRPVVVWLTLPPEFAPIVAFGLASAGIVLAYRVIHLIEIIDWELIKTLIPWKR